MTNRDNKPGSGNTPLYALIAAVLLVALALGTLLLIDSEKSTTPVFLTVIGLIVTTVPSLIAAAFAERASRDIRNGTLRSKVTEALVDAGVAEPAPLPVDGPTRYVCACGLSTPDPALVDSSTIPCPVGGFHAWQLTDEGKHRA